MAAIPQIRACLKAVLDQLADTTVTVLDRRPGTVPILPALWPQPATADYASTQAGRGQDVYQWEIVAAVSMADLDLAQERLDGLLADGPGTVRDLIRADRTLGLTDGTTVWVEGMTYGVAPFPGQEQDVLGAALRLTVRTTG